MTLPRIWAGTPEDLWAFQQQTSTICESLFAAVPAARRNEVDARAAAELARFADGDVLRVPVNVVIATARKGNA